MLNRRTGYHDGSGDVILEDFGGGHEVFPKTKGAPKPLMCGPAQVLGDRWGATVARMLPGAVDEVHAEALVPILAPIFFIEAFDDGWAL